MIFKPLQRDTIYSGRVFQVDKIKMQLPDGSTRYYDLVNHPSAVVIVPLDDAGNILFVHQYRVGADMELMELPAGLLNEGEDPAEAALRETGEEIGMGIGKLLLLGNFYSSPGYSSERLHIYLATGLFPAPLVQDDDEFLQVEAIPALKAMQMARTGEIQDAKTLAALLMAEPHFPS